MNVTYETHCVEEGPTTHVDGYLADGDRVIAQLDICCLGDKECPDRDDAAVRAAWDSGRVFLSRPEDDDVPSLVVPVDILTPALYTEAVRRFCP